MTSLTEFAKQANSSKFTILMRTIRKFNNKKNTNRDQNLILTPLSLFKSKSHQRVKISICRLAEIDV